MSKPEVSATLNDLWKSVEEKAAQAEAKANAERAEEERKLQIIREKLQAIVVKRLEEAQLAWRDRARIEIKPQLARPSGTSKFLSVSFRLNKTDGRLRRSRNYSISLAMDSEVCRVHEDDAQVNFLDKGVTHDRLAPLSTDLVDRVLKRAVENCFS